MAEEKFHLSYIEGELDRAQQGEQAGFVAMASIRRALASPSSRKSAVAGTRGAREDPGAGAGGS